MPVFFLIVGAMMLTAAVRGKSNVTELTELLKRDFTGPNNYFTWVFGIGAVAAIGYIPDPAAKKISNAFLLLIFLVLFIGKPAKDGRNIFSSFKAQVTGS